MIIKLHYANKGILQVQVPGEVELYYILEFRGDTFRQGETHNGLMNFYETRVCKLKEIIPITIPTLEIVKD